MDGENTTYVLLLFVITCYFVHANISITYTLSMQAACTSPKCGYQPTYWHSIIYQNTTGL
jgi:hypothetical protein